MISSFTSKILSEKVFKGTTPATEPKLWCTNCLWRHKKRRQQNRFEWSPIPGCFSSSNKESRSARIISSCSRRHCWLAVAACSWSTTLSRSFCNNTTT